MAKHGGSMAQKIEIEKILKNPTFEDVYQVFELFTIITEKKLRDYAALIASLAHLIPGWMKVFIISDNELLLYNFQTEERKLICSIENPRAKKIIHFARFIFLDSDHDQAVLHNVSRGIHQAIIGYNEAQVDEQCITSFLVSLATEKKLEGLYRFPSQIITSWRKEDKKIVLPGIKRLSIVCNTMHQIKEIVRECTELEVFEVATQVRAVEVFALMKKNIKHVAVRRSKISPRETVDISQIGSVEVQFASELEIIKNLTDLRAVRFSNKNIATMIEDREQLAHADFISVEYDCVNPERVKELFSLNGYSPPDTLILNWDSQEKLQKVLDSQSLISELMEALIIAVGKGVKRIILPSILKGKMEFILSTFTKTKVITNVPHFFA